MVSIHFVRGKYPYKYTAVVSYKNGKVKRVSFGHQDYQQYRDGTDLKLYKRLDHLDFDRRRRYRARHSKIFNKDGMAAYKIKYSRAWFSYHYLW